uniref:CSON014777 protein n=1 Tax=Culicoides sonorensis TaxID=179676 RepID=A0A336K5I0_CULSO
MNITMNSDTITALKSRAAFMPGGRDLHGNLLIIVTVPPELIPKSKEHLDICLNFIIDTLNPETLNNGLLLVIDAQKSNARLTNTWIEHVQSVVDPDYLKLMLVIRPDAFWDKQRMDNCTKPQKKGEWITIQRSRLNKYIDLSELPDDLGGTFTYNHEQWIQNHVRIQEYKKAYEKAIHDLQNLYTILVDSQSPRLIRPISSATEINQTLKTCISCGNEVQKYVAFVMDMGNRLITQINDLQNSKAFTSQDLLDARETIKSMLNRIEKKQMDLKIEWDKFEKRSHELRELAILESRVTEVTNWILGTADNLLNGHLKVGFDIQTSEKLRKDHEILELHCWKTYGAYAELLYKIDTVMKQKENSEYLKDLKSQRDFMDFVCRSFATRLERRRNILITSVRFFRLVNEYFSRTSDVFDSLIMGDKVDDYDIAVMKLKKLQSSQISLDSIERQLMQQGEKLSDMLSMPVKDALGRDVTVDYSDDIANIRDILEATTARRNIFIDSVELQKLTLEQISHIHTYENDAATAIEWINDLYRVMIKAHTHVGCSVSEIQSQKEEHQNFQDTAKNTFNYGCQLLNAALALRQSCKLSVEKNQKMVNELEMTWKNLQIVSQEQLTRLRVSAVFYRSVEDHCQKLIDIKNSVLILHTVSGRNQRLYHMRKYLITREKLMIEVGRMIRLGRLLRTRLREPFILNENGEIASSENTSMSVDNSIACESISEKLLEVGRISEALDRAIKETQDDLDLHFSDSNDTDAENRSTEGHRRGGINSSDDWNSSVKSSATEDETAYLTASEGHSGTLHSRSSSYHTASECAASVNSPWWETAERSSLDSSDQEAPTMELLSGVVVSSASTSFDDSENQVTFHSPVISEPEHDLHILHDAHEELIIPLEPQNQLPPPSSKRNSMNASPRHSANSFETPEDDMKSSSSMDLLDEVGSAYSTDKISSESHQSPASDTKSLAEFAALKISGLSYYYQNIMTKQALKTCL